MNATWLGQAGMYFRTDDGLCVMVDPYLSNHLEEAGGAEMARQVPVDESWFDQPLDVLILTHVHGDHTDMHTLRRLLDRPEPVEVLASLAAWEKIRNVLPPQHNYVMFNAGTEWTHGETTFCAVPAIHNDPYAIGVTFSADEVRVYMTGDTLYDRRLLDAVKQPVDYFFPVINGKGNNMNPIDAARLTRELAPRHAVPLHWDMFLKFAADPADYTQRLADSGVAVLVMRQYVSVDLQKHGEA